MGNGNLDLSAFLLVTTYVKRSNGKSGIISERLASESTLPQYPFPVIRVTYHSYARGGINEGAEK